jgi:hypothetical protein
VILSQNVSPEVKQQLKQMLDQKGFEHVRREEVNIDPDTGEVQLWTSLW